MKYSVSILYYSFVQSPSMRREWIEILCLLNRLIHPESPSMRREWIEIAIMPIVLLAEMVSLHAEGVD